MHSSVACLMLALAVIFSAGFSSCDAPTSLSPQTPQLAFSTYLGGSIPFAPGAAAHTFGQNADCDAQGNTYVTGATQVADLPVLHAFQPSPAPLSVMSAFVAKYDPAGQPLWCTYLGGDNLSMGIGVAAMPDGGVAVAGMTNSDAAGPFPVMDGFQDHNAGLTDYFVTVFDASGHLRYSTYLGGSGVEGEAVFSDDNANGNNIAVDAQGLVYVTGTTSSTDFPLTDNALQPTLNGTTNAFLTIINPAMSGRASLVYSSYLGGDNDNKGHSVAVDASGRYIAAAGYTDSTNFPIPPTANSFHRTAPDSFTSNAFVVQITSSQPGSPAATYAMRYGTYLGARTGDPRDDAYGMTYDGEGRIVVTGRTQSADFPMTSGGPTIFNSAPYLSHKNNSGDEPYLVKIDPSRDGDPSLAYATFLGGGQKDGDWGGFCTSVGVDSRGAVYVAGESDAYQGVEYHYDPANLEAPQEFPYTGDAYSKTLQGEYDVIFMQIDPSGASLDYSTYLGGRASDRAYGLAIDPANNIALSGLTFSRDFPLKNPAQLWPGNAGSNAFVCKFSGHALETGSIWFLWLDDNGDDF